jgi:hypothetical protein
MVDSWIIISSVATGIMDLIALLEFFKRRKTEQQNYFLRDALNSCKQTCKNVCNVNVNH